jgi:hypothetical protein
MPENDSAVTVQYPSGLIGRFARRSELSHVEFVCKWGGKEDFDMLKLFACTLVVLSLAGVGANAAETGTKTFPTSSIYPPRTPPPVWGPRTHYRPMYNYVRPHHHYCYLPSGRCGNNHRVEN